VKLALLACILITACGGAKSASTRAPNAAPEAGAASPLAPDPMQQIDDLEHQIATDSDQLQLGAIRLPETVPPPQPLDTSSTTDPRCKPAKHETCKTSCALSDAICTNAGKICRIARDDLPGDTKAAGKCARANTTCDKSHEKCCGCQ